MARKGIHYIFGSVEERFWPKVDRTPGHGPNGDCWLWIAGAINDYGIMAAYGKRSCRATHVSLILSGQPRPDGHDALHSCDTPRCVNPAHLRWGTDKQNKADAIMRCRVARMTGERHPSAKLGAEQVLAIRASTASGADEARRYNVTKEQIYRIRKRQVWKHI